MEEIAVTTLASTGRTRHIMDRIRSTIRETVPGAKVILYGSRARGNTPPDSDWDLVILVHGPVSQELEETILRRLYRLGLELDEILSPLVYSQSAWDSPLHRATPFHKNVVGEGIVC